MYEHPNSRHIYAVSPSGKGVSGVARRKHYKISANLSEAGLRKVNELKAGAGCASDEARSRGNGAARYRFHRENIAYECG